MKALHKTHKITIPFPDPKPGSHVAYKLAYSKPSNVNVVGSYASKTMVKSESVLSVDMVVVMPASIFQEKDYLNYRYFYKRAYYLACIAAGLHDTAQDQISLCFEYLHGNTLRPILVAKPKSGTISSFPFHSVLIDLNRQIKFGLKLPDPYHSCSSSIFLQQI